MAPDRGITVDAASGLAQNTAREDIEREAKSHLQLADQAEERVQQLEVELERWSTEMRQHRQAAHALASVLSDGDPEPSMEQPHGLRKPSRAATLDRLSRED